MSISRRLAVACDLFTSAEIAAFLGDLKPSPGTVKFGLQAALAVGLPAVLEHTPADSDAFLDLKLHDIPNTVARAVQSVASWGRVRYLTVHGAGGKDMLAAAQEAASKHLELICVTRLTSVAGQETDPSVVLDIAAQAWQAGIGWVVASVHECAALKREFPGLKVVTPGIRPRGYDRPDDQRRIATPQRALREGSDMLVIGRPLYATKSPAVAWQELLDVERGD
jgi:orotidine-5'-phosphate decarboxylase